MQAILLIIQLLIMNRFKNLLPVAVLALAVVTAFAFKPIENKKFLDINCTWFEYTGDPAPPNGTQPFDPANYATTSLTETQIHALCAVDEILCYICVPASEIYTSGDNVGKPKVDQVDDPGTVGTDESSEINRLLNTALASPAGTSFSNGGNDWYVDFKADE
jgi:hypothetical protein